jgi:hypothetical protein
LRVSPLSPPQRNTQSGRKAAASYAEGARLIALRHALAQLDQPPTVRASHRFGCLGSGLRDDLAVCA